MATVRFSPTCTRCARLAEHLARIRTEFPDYHARPVAPFGDAHPRLLIVGLAPGMHGANRTGRPFTGDYAGILLYDTLHRFGFSNRATATDSRDGLRLTGCRITNAVKCLPPENKPTPAEVKNCNAFLKGEITESPAGTAVLALGAIAHRAVLLTLGLKISAFPFAHGARYLLPGDRVLYDSYHCSRYNTQTRRLTPDMFRAVFAAIVKDLEQK